MNGPGSVTLSGRRARVRAKRNSSTTPAVMPWLSAAEVRRQLLVQKGYLDDVLPTVQTITTKLNTLGYFPKKVAKSQPQKKSPKPRQSSHK